MQHAGNPLFHLHSDSDECAMEDSSSTTMSEQARDSGMLGNYSTRIRPDRCGMDRRDPSVWGDRSERGEGDRRGGGGGDEYGECGEDKHGGDWEYGHEESSSERPQSYSQLGKGTGTYYQENILLFHCVTGTSLAIIENLTSDNDATGTARGREQVGGVEVGGSR